MSTSTLTMPPGPRHDPSALWPMLALGLALTACGAATEAPTASRSGVPTTRAA